MNDLPQLRDKLIGALIGLARATDGNEHLISRSSTAVIVESLAATMNNVDFNIKVLEMLTSRVEDEKRKMVPNCFTCASPCGRTSDYDMNNLLNEEEETRFFKRRILSGIQEIAADVCQSASPEALDDVVERLFYEALIVIGIDGLDAENYRQIIVELDSLKRRSNFLRDTPNFK